MRRQSLFGVFGTATVAGVVLSSCGGGVGEALASVAFIGSAGGAWQEDNNSAQPGLQQKFACTFTANGVGTAGTDGCFINIQPVNPPANLYATGFDVSFTGNLPGCPLASTSGGRIEGKHISLPGCFTGEYVTINQSVSTDGTHRMFFDFVPGLTDGIWAEVQYGQRRFKFATNSAGCEFTATGRPAVTVVIVGSDVSKVAGPFETTVGSFTIAGDAGGAWSGRFEGVSGMSLRRGSEVLELQRRNEAPSSACP